MNNKTKLPVIFLRELVIFPEMSVTLTIGREVSRLAVRASQEQFQNSLVTMTQLRAEDEEIKDFNAVYRLGTICKVEKVVALTDGGMQVQVEGLGRFKGDSLEWQSGVAFIQGELLSDTEPSCESDSRELLESLSSYQPVNFDKIAWLERKDLEEMKRINARVAERQAILEEPSAKERLRLLRALGQAKS